MLHSLAYSTLDKIIRIGNKYCFHCFRWNAVGNIEVTTNAGKLLRWKILGCVQILYTFFIYARLYHSVAILGIPIERCTIHIVFSAGYSFYAGTTINSFRKPKEIAEFLNNFFRTDKLFKPLPHQVPKSKKFGKLVRLLYILCLSTGLLHAPLFLALPRNANFVFSVLSPHVIHNRMLYVVLECCFAVLELFLGLAAWAAGSVVYSITFCVVANCLPMWAEVMKYDVNWRQIPIPRQKYYRTVQLLMTQFNDCFGYDAFLIITILVYFGMVACSFATLRYYGKLPFFAYSVFPTAATVIILYVSLVYPSAGRAGDSHVKMVRQWRYIESHSRVDNKQQNDTTPTPNPGVSRRNWALLAKKEKSFNKRKHNLAFIRSCRPIGFKVGFLFTVKPGTTLTYADMVLDQLINCLISF